MDGARRRSVVADGPGIDAGAIARPSDPTLRLSIAASLIYLEKVLPGGALIGRAAGFALCAAGIARMLG